MADIGRAYEGIANNEARIWKLLAYLGRYGHQPVNVALKLTLRELNALAAQVAELVREENDANRSHSSD